MAPSSGIYYMGTCWISKRAQDSSPASAEAVAAKLALPQRSWLRRLGETGRQTPMNLRCARMTAPRARLRQPQRLRLRPQWDPLCTRIEGVSALHKAVAATNTRL